MPRDSINKGLTDLATAFATSAQVRDEAQAARQKLALDMAFRQGQIDEQPFKMLKLQGEIDMQPSRGRLYEAQADKAIGELGLLPFRSRKLAAEAGTAEGELGLLPARQALMTAQTGSADATARNLGFEADRGEFELNNLRALGAGNTNPALADLFQAARAGLNPAQLADSFAAANKERDFGIGLGYTNPQDRQPLLTARGGVNPQQVEAAGTLRRDRGVVDQMLAGQADPAAVGDVYAAADGKLPPSLPGPRPQSAPGEYETLAVQRQAAIDAGNLTLAEDLGNRMAKLTRDGAGSQPAYLQLVAAREQAVAAGDSERVALIDAQLNKLNTVAGGAATEVTNFTPGLGGNLGRFGDMTPLTMPVNVTEQARLNQAMTNSAGAISQLQDVMSRVDTAASSDFGLPGTVKHTVGAVADQLLPGPEGLYSSATGGADVETLRRESQALALKIAPDLVNEPRITAEERATVAQLIGTNDAFSTLAGARRSTEYLMNLLQTAHSRNQYVAAASQGADPRQSGQFRRWQIGNQTFVVDTARLQPDDDPTTAIIYQIQPGAPLLEASFDPVSGGVRTKAGVLLPTMPGAQ